MHAYMLACYACKHVCMCTWANLTTARLVAIYRVATKLLSHFPKVCQFYVRISSKTVRDSDIRPRSGSYGAFDVYFNPKFGPYFAEKYFCSNVFDDF